MTTAPVRLTELTSCGGCAAKWGASLLGELVGELVATARVTGDEGLLVGLAPSDDAAVVQLSPDLALVSTTDFFPPLVDDPADFGAIAAANACSDVFAMGGDVILALNVAAFPEDLPTEVIQAIFRAAASVVAAAGGVVAGGHTIRSPEPIFGLAVQGVVRPGEQFVKGGARPGDVLVLSKPLGTGLALASGDPAIIGPAVTSMRQLNREAAAALRRERASVHAVTDVTGFGLLGHGWEMADRSQAHLVFDSRALPLLDGVLEVAARGTRTGGDVRNRDYVAGHVTLAVAAPRDDGSGAADAADGEALAAIAFDPQTSGGLLAAVASEAVDRLTAAPVFDGAGVGFVAVGQVIDAPAGVTLR